MKLIDKSALVAEIERLAEVKPIDEFQPQVQNKIDWLSGKLFAINSLRVFLDTLEVKEVDLEREQRMKECPYIQVECKMYESHTLQCNGTCNWLVDYLKLKELKTQKGEL